MQACLQDRHLLCALLSGMAVLFRQTNAVWACFILGVSYLAVTYQLSHGLPAMTVANTSASGFASCAGQLFTEALQAGCCMLVSSGACSVHCCSLRPCASVPHSLVQGTLSLSNRESTLPVPAQGYPAQCAQSPALEWALKLPGQNPARMSPYASHVLHTGHLGQPSPGVTLPVPFLFCRNMEPIRPALTQLCAGCRAAPGLQSGTQQARGCFGGAGPAPPQTPATGAGLCPWKASQGATCAPCGHFAAGGPDPKGKLRTLGGCCCALGCPAQHEQAGQLGGMPPSATRKLSMVDAHPVEGVWWRLR